MKNNKGVVGRVVAILGAFADGEPSLAISQLSERLNLPPSSVHRLLEQLIALEIIERANHRRYRIGPEFFRIGARAEVKFKIVETARSLMQNLTDEIKEACVLSVLMRSKRQRLRVAKLDSAQQPLNFKIGMLEHHSLVWGAAGRAILAHMQPDEVEKAFAEAPPYSTTGKQLPASDRLMKNLEQVRANGFAFARGEMLSPETIAVAAPLFGVGQHVVGELCIIAPASRFADNMLAPVSSKLIETTRELSALLGAGTRSTTIPRAKTGLSRHAP